MKKVYKPKEVNIKKLQMFLKKLKDGRLKN